MILIKTSPTRRGFLLYGYLFVMEDFEEKYNMLMKFLLPRANKCIQSFEKIRFIEKEGNLIPIIKVNLKQDCLGGYGKIVGIKGDIFSELIQLNQTYFPKRNINSDIRNIFINKDTY
jgi:hypothetical protein